MLGAFASAAIARLTEIGATMPVNGLNPINYCNLLFAGNAIAGVGALVFYKDQFRPEVTREVSWIGWAWIAAFTLIDGILVGMLYFVALAHVDVLTADVLSLVEIPLCVMAGAVLQRRGVGWRGVLAIVLVVAGLVAAVFGEAEGGGLGGGMMGLTGDTTGIAAALLAGVAGAAATLMGEQVYRHAPVGLVQGIENLVGALVFWALAVHLYGFDHFAALPATLLWQWMALYGLLFVLGGGVLEAVAQTRIPAGLIGLLAALSPVFAAVAGFLVLGQVPTWLSLAGGALAVGGVLVGARTLAAEGETEDRSRPAIPERVPLRRPSGQLVGATRALAGVLVVFAVLFALASETHARADHDILDAWSAGRSLERRPAPQQGGPTTVEAAFLPISLEQVDGRSQTFVATGYYLFIWTDPRLQGIEPQPGNDTLVITADHAFDEGGGVELWNPRIEWVNLVRTWANDDGVVEIHPDGTIEYWGRLTATFSAQNRFSGSIDFHWFPFDTQRLVITVSSLIYDDAEVRFEVFGDTPVLTDPHRDVGQLRNDEWKIIGQHESTDSIDLSLAPGEHWSAFEKTLVLRRERLSYLLKIVLPAVLNVSLAFISLFLPRADFSQRMSLSVGSLVAIIGLNFIVGGLLPRVGYLTFMDVLLLTCGLIPPICLFAHMLERRHEDGRWERRARFLAGGLLVLILSAVTVVGLLDLGGMMPVG